MGTKDLAQKSTNTDLEMVFGPCVKHSLLVKEFGGVVGEMEIPRNLSHASKNSDGVLEIPYGPAR